jgi:hypothetical protein
MIVGSRKDCGHWPTPQKCRLPDVYVPLAARAGWSDTELAVRAALWCRKRDEENRGAWLTTKSIPTQKQAKRCQTGTRRNRHSCKRSNEEVLAEKADEWYLVAADRTAC